MQVIKNIGLFIQNQVLGMKWLNELIGSGLTGLGVDLNSRIGGSIQFFIYDMIKILFLLSFLIFIISYIQSYFPPERTKQILGKYKGVGANTMGALLGTVTPFCSCSSIPLFIGFTKAGLPLGVTFSFLISSPLVDIGAFILLTSIFGFKIALTYVLVGLLLAILGGTVIGKLGMESQIEEYVKTGENVDMASAELTKSDRIAYSKEQVGFTVKKVFWYIGIGVGIGALIHNWIPTEVVQGVIGDNNPFSVFIATIVGIPMYADIFGTLPIAEALFYKGVGIGTILSFMMGVTALSLPSIIMLRKLVKPKLLMTFVGVIGSGIIVIGYIFNGISFVFV